MTYCTFERFQGVWLGSIIAAAIADDCSQSEVTNLSQYQPQPWIVAREQIATILIKAEGRGKKYLAQQLNQILQARRELSTPDRLQKLPGKTDSDNLEEAKNWVQHNTVLSLLPLTIFYGNDGTLFTEIVERCNLKSANALEIKQDILVWNYLLTSALHDKFNFQHIDVDAVIKQVLASIKVKTALMAKLKLIHQAWSDGLGLHQLTEQLLSQDHAQAEISAASSAIALSFYCFVTTPHDFKLSIKRAKTVNYQLAWLTTVLTASLSGAYNGVTGIPRNWRLVAQKNQTYQQSIKTVTELFQTWLGIYAMDSHQFLYAQEFQAVASPNIIQSRKTLKIISQKLYSS